MPTTGVPDPRSRDEQITRWAFNFFMVGVALSIVFAIVYLLVL